MLGPNRSFIVTNGATFEWFHREWRAIDRSWFTSSRSEIDSRRAELRARCAAKALELSTLKPRQSDDATYLIPI